MISKINLTYIFNLMLIIIFSSAISIFSCQSNGELAQKTYNNFSINGDSSTPLIIIGTPAITDSVHCFMAILGDSIRIKSMKGHSSARWLVDGKTTMGLNINFVPDRLGIIKISKLDEEGNPIALKCLCVSKNRNTKIKKSNIKNSLNKSLNSTVEELSNSGSNNNKSPELSPFSTQEYKFLTSNKVTFEMTNCKPTKDYETTKLERTLSGGEYYYIITKNIFKTILHKACNEKEISVELKNYKGKMIVEYYIQKSENQNKGQYPDIAIKSIQFNDKEHKYLLEELKKYN